MVLADVSRKQAFLTHLSFSLVVFIVLLYFIALEWYPSFYYKLDNGYIGTATIFFVDVVLGPGLTLLVFKPGKPKLKLDITLILVFQLVALVWGVKSVYEDRPAVTVFHDGRFLCMTQTVAEDVDVERISMGKSGNQKLAYLAIPESFDERGEFMREAYLHNVSSEYYYGSRFEPINENNINEILEYELSLSEVKEENPENIDMLNSYIEKNPGFKSRYYFYPIRGRFNTGIAVFDPVAMRIIEVLDARSMLFAKEPEIDYQDLEAVKKTLSLTRD